MYVCTRVLSDHEVEDDAMWDTPTVNCHSAALILGGY